MSDLTLSPEALALVSTPPQFQRVKVRSVEHWKSLRSVDVTASAVGALFPDADFPWFGRFGLWEIKTGRRPDAGTSSRAMRRGNGFEALAFDELAEMFPDWSISPLGNRYFYRDPATRVGATPDGFAIRPDREGFGVVQIKTATFLTKGKWIDEDGNPYCATWIGLQAMTEAKLTGASWAAVVVMIVDSEEDLIVVDVPLFGDVWEAITREASQFWATIAAGEMPEADPARDYGAIMRTFPRDNGDLVDMSGDQRLAEIAPNYVALRAVEAAGRAATEKRRVFDAEIILKLGAAKSAVIAGGALVETKTIRKATGSYRQVKIYNVGTDAGEQPAMF